MPMMPFIGVRISWLMLARNSLLARLAASAASLASRSSASLARSSLVRSMTLFSTMMLVGFQLRRAQCDAFHLAHTAHAGVN